MDTLQMILRDKGSKVHVTNPQTTVRSAVELMCESHIGALLVMTSGVIVGMFSERDLMTRVVLAGRDPETTRVGDVMTRDVVCVDSGLSVSDAMAIVTMRRVRHLPVSEGLRVVGLVSIGDLVRWRIRDYEEEIDHLRNYFAGYPV
jgi:signal-transduction protein with cAMP-binding, CBS, and nucleotidyltransferase domain